MEEYTTTRSLLERIFAGESLDDLLQSIGTEGFLPSHTYYDKTRNCVFDGVKTYTGSMLLQSGHVFERLFEIYFATVRHNDFQVYRGKINIDPHPLTTRELIEGKINLGSSNGESDITLKNKKTGKWILLSCKYYKQEKPADRYDVSAIYHMLHKECPRLREITTIGVCAKSKDDFKNSIEYTSHTYIKTSIDEDFIFGRDDLAEFLEQIRGRLGSIDRIIEIMDSEKARLDLKFHQMLIQANIVSQYVIGNREFIIGAMPRSGKSFICAGIIDGINKCVKGKTPLRVLITTPRPKESIASFLNIFQDYEEFKDFYCTRLEHKQDLSQYDKLIVLCSDQLIKDYPLTNLANTTFDIIFKDEAHSGSLTSLAEKAYSVYKTDDVCLIYMTGTYIRPAKKLKNAILYTWDLHDINSVISGNFSELEERFSKIIVNRIIKKLGRCSITKYYSSFPKLCLISAKYSDRFKERLAEEDIGQDGYGFCMKTLFTINEGRLKYEDYVRDLFSYNLFGMGIYLQTNL